MSLFDDKKKNDEEERKRVQDRLKQADTAINTNRTNQANSVSDRLSLASERIQDNRVSKKFFDNKLNTSIALSL